MTGHRLVASGAKPSSPTDHAAPEGDLPMSLLLPLAAVSAVAAVLWWVRRQLAADQESVRRFTNRKKGNRR
ncbi:hypothetical protein GCM10009800_21490 [Nocardiopsis rhodophaea]